MYVAETVVQDIRAGKKVSSIELLYQLGSRMVTSLPVRLSESMSADAAEVGYTSHGSSRSQPLRVYERLFQRKSVLEDVVPDICADTLRD